MASGLPIAAFLQNSSDGHNILKLAQCGISADSENKNNCINAMKYLFSQKDSFSEIGKNGERYAIQNFSKEVCISNLEAMIINIKK